MFQFKAAYDEFYADSDSFSDGAKTRFLENIVGKPVIKHTGCIDDGVVVGEVVSSEIINKEIVCTFKIIHKDIIEEIEKGVVNKLSVSFIMKTEDLFNYD